MYNSCLNCKRTLTDPESRRNGFGPDCAETLRQQAVWIDAAKQAIKTGATDDSTLMVLGRILKRSEDKLLTFREDEIVPDVIVHTLHNIRRDFARRARLLHGLGQLYVPEMQIQIREETNAVYSFS